MTEQKRISLGNPLLKLDQGLWHLYSQEEIDSVVAMSNALYRICPLPDKDTGVRLCPLNCPFRPYRQSETGCTVAQALIGDKWRLQRWADRQDEINGEYRTVENED